MPRRWGIAAAVAMTDVCSRVARRMGYANYPAIVVPHPAASRTDDWLKARAVETTATLVQMVAPDRERVAAPA